MDKGAEEAMEKRVCTGCGRKLNQNEDVFCGQKEWGYFSGKDTQIHCFILCEACYDKLIGGFRIPVKVKEQTELL